jgi:signal transduction histidine kinase
MVVQKSKEINIIENIPSPLKNQSIVSDEQKLQQIMNNLLSNAIKYTQTGYIEYGVRLENSNELLFYVKDTGIGIPKNKWDSIFKPFQQVNESITNQYGGTGLGLAITKKLIKMLNGRIWIDSQRGEGSTFYFTIPMDMEITL